MVAIVRSPSQCQLRQITRTHNDGILLICDVHQYLCPFASLCVLIGDIVLLRVMTYILEMLCHSLGDADLTDSHTEGLHQFYGIVMGAVCRTETRHSDTDDSLAVQS